MTTIQRIKLVFISLIVTVAFSAPPVHATDSLLFGQTQNYSVTLRSDKNTVTTAKLVFTNGEESDKSKIKITVPDGIKASAVSVYQVLPPKKNSEECKTYETYDKWVVRKNRYDTTTPRTEAELKSQYENQKVCVEFTETSQYDIDYDFNNYANSQSYGLSDSYRTNSNDSALSFSKLTPKVSGNSYTLDLKEKIKSQKDGAILVSYLGNGFISGFAGNYSYEYKTLIVEDAVTTVAVSLNLDEDLYAKDTKARTTATNTTGISSGISDGAQAARNVDQESRTLTNLTNTIGSGGTIVRNGKDLLPGDTFAVSGSFADSAWKLYFKELGIFALLTGVIALTWYLIAKRRNKHIRKTAKDPLDTINPKVQNEHVKNDAHIATTQDIGFINQPLNLLVAGLSALISIVITGLLIVVIGIVASDSYGSNDGTAGTQIAAMIVFAYSAFIVPLFVTIRYGLKTVFAWITIAVTLVVILIALLVVASMPSSDSDYDSRSGSRRSSFDSGINE